MPETDHGEKTMKEDSKRKQAKGIKWPTVKPCKYFQTVTNKRN
jgi:hypothetical protein